MDDRDKNAIGGGVVGAAVGALISGGPGALAGGAIGSLLGSREKKHNGALRETVYNLQKATDGEPRFYVDHIDPDGAEERGPRNLVDDLTMEPDLVMIGQRYPNLIIEVETVAAIRENPGHVLDQLNDFRTQGFKRVLVVPEDDLNEVMEWLEYQERENNIYSEVTVSTPERVIGVL